MTKIIPGQKIGRWTVLDEYIKVKKGEKKWLCRCECGTERYVLERSLKHGASQSCGCLRKEAAKKALSNEIEGQTFGDLTVLERSAVYHKNGGIWWKCQCSCGNVCEVPSTLLVKGRKTHCGCKSQKMYYFADIRDQRFSRLVAMRPTERRDSTGGIVWLCKCDCGNEVEVPYNNLMYANQRSCGCQKKEHDQLLGKLQTRVDGTSLDIIKSKKVPTDNTTGYKGVYLIKGKYVAKIVFRKKAYYLGTYDDIEQAHQARLDAEEALFEPTLEYHAKWQEKADADPAWAAENPMKITVSIVNHQLNISFLPLLDA